MIIFYFHIQELTILELKRNTPRQLNRDTPLVFSVTPAAKIWTYSLPKQLIGFAAINEETSLSSKARKIIMHLVWSQQPSRVTLIPKIKFLIQLKSHVDYGEKIKWPRRLIKVQNPDLDAKKVVGHVDKANLKSHNLVRFVQGS